MSKRTVELGRNHCLSAHTESMYKSEHFASSGSATLSVEVAGYWSDVITVYLRREMDHAAAMRAARENPEGTVDFDCPSFVRWTATLSHASGGRDTKEEPDDLQAAVNFACALQWAAQLGRELLQQRDVYERRYQAERAAARAQREAEQAAKQARIDADAPMGEEMAAALLARAVAVRKLAGPHWDSRADLAFTLEPRGGREHGQPGQLFVGLTANNAALLRLNGRNITRTAAVAALAAASHRTNPASPAAA